MTSTNKKVIKYRTKEIFEMKMCFQTQVDQVQNQIKYHQTLQIEIKDQTIIIVNLRKYIKMTQNPIKR